MSTTRFCEACHISRLGEVIGAPLAMALAIALKQGCGGSLGVCPTTSVIFLEIPSYGGGSSLGGPFCCITEGVISHSAALQQYWTVGLFVGF